MELLVTSILPARLSDAIATKNRAAGWPQFSLNFSFSQSSACAMMGAVLRPGYHLGSELQHVPSLPSFLASESASSRWSLIISPSGVFVKDQVQCLPWVKLLINDSCVYHHAFA